MSKVFYSAQNLTIGNGFVRNPDRYYLEEYFDKLPPSSVPINSINNILTKNNNFMISGAGAQSVDFDTNNTTRRAGIILTTATAANNNSIISPITDLPGQSPWNNIKWFPEKQIEWECALSIQQTSDIHVWAGLKLTNTKTIATDNDQVFFITEINNGQFFWNVVVSISGVDYRSRVPGAIVADKIYKLRITTDSSRFARVYINDVQYNITTTTGANANVVTTGSIPSKALTNNADLKPFIGIETDSGAKMLNVYYQKISRTLL